MSLGIGELSGRQDLHWRRGGARLDVCVEPLTTERQSARLNESHLGLNCQYLNHQKYPPSRTSPGSCQVCPVSQEYSLSGLWCLSCSVAQMLNIGAVKHSSYIFSLLFTCQVYLERNIWFLPQDFFQGLWWCACLQHGVGKSAAKVGPIHMNSVKVLGAHFLLEILFKCRFWLIGFGAWDLTFLTSFWVVAVLLALE